MTSVAFPPAAGPWPAVDPTEEGWDPEGLEAVLAHAGGHGSTALLVTLHGRVLAERTWPPPAGLQAEVRADGTTREDVASAQKSVTSLLVGIAHTRGLLDLDDPVCAHLGGGWSGAPPEHERAVTVRHLLSMTSGLDDALRAVAPPGERWDYNLGAGYHTLKRVLVAASGLSLDRLSRDWLFDPVGAADTAWAARALPAVVPEGLRPMLCYPDGAPLEGLHTTARDLARFGLLVLAGGVWDGVDLGLAAYLAEALVPSSAHNPAYGLLWWLNGRSWQLAPRNPTPVEGWLVPDAPADLVAALGALGRSVHVVPSQGLVVVRTGADPGDTPLAASGFGRTLWTLLRRAGPGWAGGA